MPAKRSLLILNGPGVGDAGADAVALGDELGVSIDLRQSGSTDEMLSTISESRSQIDGLIINPGNSGNKGIQAALDSSISSATAVVELHLDNPFQDDIATQPLVGVQGKISLVCGLGEAGYPFAVRSLARRLAAVAQ